MSKWEMVRLGDVCIIERGGSPRPIQSYITNAENGINWIKIGDTEPNSMYINKTKEKIKPEGVKKSRYVQKGDFVLSNSMSFGRPYIMNIDGCIHDGWLLIRDEKNVFDKKFLYYSLSSPSTFLKFKSSAVGGVVNNLNSDIVRKTTIPLPPLEFQKHIAETLDKVSEIINLHKKRLEELDNLIKSTFYDMFGDPFLDNKGFGIKKLGNVTIINPKKNEVKDIGEIEVSFIPMDKVGKNGEFDVSFKKMLFEVYKGFTYFKEGDVLFAKITPCMENGKGAIALNLVNGIGFGSTEFHVIRPTNEINQYWLYNLTSLKMFRKLAERKMTGSAGQKRVPKDFLSEVEIVVPPIELQNKFAQIVTRIEEQKNLEKQAINESENLFNSLMNKYFD